ENFYILEGGVDIYVDNVKHTLTKGQFIHIEPHEVHYLINASGAPVKLVSSLAPYRQSDKIEVENPKLG
ncbi:MAG: cupin domain-containing protein, partial [Spirochaetaceae bacterium]|nr:cupin domain-containing protein [Spirochaetaceae bacterium]